jgi:hypothetical protein
MKKCWLCQERSGFASESFPLSTTFRECLKKEETMEEKTENEQEVSQEELQDITGGAAYSDIVIAAASQFRSNAAKNLFQQGNFEGGMRHLRGATNILSQAKGIQLRP